MENDIQSIILKKIQELLNETSPTYCGQHEFDLWAESRRSKIDVLEELLDELK